MTREEQILQEIEKLSPHDAYIRGRCDMWDAISSNDRKEILADIEQILRNLEKAKSMTSRCWIPVSERLPEMGVRVLCACQADLYDVLKLTPEGWFYDTRHTYMFGFVRAWMPLPEPYTEGYTQQVIGGDKNV